MISGLLVFFIVLTLVTMARGIDVDCGCFGSLSRKSGAGVIVEDVAMLYLGLCILFAPKTKGAEKGLPPEGPVYHSELPRGDSPHR
jgi:hypothetical protein